MMLNKKRLIDLAGFLLIALVLLVGYKLSPLVLGKADVALLPKLSCNLQSEPCVRDLPDGGRVMLSLGEQPVPLLKPFPVRVEVQGASPSRVSIDFEGHEMPMGLNRSELVAGGPGTFTGSATLPVCVTGRMRWRATVLVETARQRIAAPFLFETAVAGDEPHGDSKP